MNKLVICIITLAVAFIVGTLSTEPFAEADGIILVNPFADEYAIVAENVPAAKIFYLPSNQDGTFGSSTFMGDIGLRIGTGIDDFDNDEDLDFIAGTRQASCPLTQECASYYLFENLGVGTFEQKLIEQDVPAGPPTDNYPAKFAIADFNGDGFNDFVSGVYRSDFVYLFTNNQDKTFTRSLIDSLTNPLEAKAGDFDEDGNMDFLISEYFARTVHFYKGDGTGAFAKQSSFTVPGIRAAALAVGDYNEDGHLDVIVDSILDFTAYMFFGDGTGTFLFDSIVYVRSSQTNLDSFDFDKDGHPDIILSDWANFVGNVYIKKGNGDGTFQPEVQVASSLSQFLTVSAPPPEDAPPDTTITSATAGKNKPLTNGGKTGSVSISFQFTGTDDGGVSSFECKLDGGAFSACTSPTSYANLKAGSHTFQVRAVDTGGNTDPTPATFSWSVTANKNK